MQGAGDGSATIGSDGTVYYAGGGTLYAINPNGSEKWQYYIGSSNANLRPLSPAIGSDGTIYAGLRASPGLHAVNPDGTKKWRGDIGGDLRSSPAIGADGTIYVGSEDGNLYAFYPNGTER